MKLNEAIKRFDLLYPNAMELPEKIALVSRLEGRINGEVLSLYGLADDTFTGYSAEDYPTTQLKAPFPFDDLYVKFLCAENDLVCGDSVRYANSARVFNDSYADFAAYMNRTYWVVCGARATTEDLG